MSFLDLFRQTETEPIVPNRDTDIFSVDKNAYETIMKEGKIFAKKITNLPKDAKDDVSSTYHSLIEKYEKIHAKQPLDHADSDYLKPQTFVLIEDLLAKLLVEFNNKKKHDQEFYTKAFLDEWKEINSALFSDFAPEFENDEYYSLYALHVFIKCEQQQLYYDEEEAKNVYNFLIEQYDKNPMEELEMKVEEMEHIYNESLFRFSDYDSICRAIGFQINDMRNEIRKAERKKQAHNA